MTLQSSFTLPASNSFEINVAAFAEHYNTIIEPGHGLFFDFSKTPEYEKPVLDYLITNFGWTLEHPTFIRVSALQIRRSQRHSPSCFRLVFG